MKTRIAAFQHALPGGLTLLRTQPHARFHASATVVVVALGFFCGIKVHEWALIVFAIVLVWVSEVLKSAVEFRADEVSLEWRERIKHAKDLAAFAVLASALGATAIGVLVFSPYLFGV